MNYHTLLGAAFIIAIGAILTLMAVVIVDIVTHGPKSQIVDAKWRELPAEERLDYDA